MIDGQLQSRRGTDVLRESGALKGTCSGLKKILMISETITVKQEERHLHFFFFFKALMIEKELNL